MKQLSFNLQIKEDLNPYKKEDFLVLDENIAAFNFLKKFFEQKDFSQSQFQSLILKGAAKSGKTHLLNIFAKEFEAEILHKNDIFSRNLSSFFVANKFYILENINKIENETFLLHLINAAHEAKSFLILSTEKSPQFEIKDLASRIKNIFSLEIKPPSHDTIKLLLINGCSRKQLKVSGSIIDFIHNHIERSYDVIASSIKLIEFYRQETGKKISMKEIAKIFK